MKKPSLLFMFDYMNFDEDKEMTEMLLSDREIDFTVQEMTRMHEGGLDSYTHILFDYGALWFSGASGLADSYEREFIKLIQKYSDVRFIVIVTIGVEFYKNLLKYDNVNVILRNEMRDIPYLLENKIGAFKD